MVKVPAEEAKKFVFSCQVEVPVLYRNVELLVVPVGSVATVVHVIAAPTPPPDVKNWPLVPALVGKLKLYVPAAA